MINRETNSFPGTIDILPEDSIELCRELVERRKKQACNFCVIGAEVSSSSRWKEWRRKVESLYTRELITIAAAVISEKGLNPGPVLSLPEKFRFLVIPYFMDIEFTLPYFQLFDYIRANGGIVSIIPPLKCWESPIRGLQPVDSCAIMVNGKTDMSSALYHLNSRKLMGFTGVNYLANGLNSTSFTHIFPMDYKLQEYTVLNCLKEGDYSISSSGKNYIRLKSSSYGEYHAEENADNIKLLMWAGRSGVQTSLNRNGTVVCRKMAGIKAVSARLKVMCREYYFLKSETGEFTAVSAPVFARLPGQLWGDHHVHSAYYGGFVHGRMDYAVYGLYGQVKKASPVSCGFRVFPGGEVHGIEKSGEPGNHHVLIVQGERKSHNYLWEPGEGWDKTITRARKHGDFTILAHPVLEDSLKKIIEGKLLPDGVEVLHGFTLFCRLAYRDPVLRERLAVLFPEQLRRLKNNSPGKNIYLEDLPFAVWDSILGRGMRCLGVADGDIHGLAFHGQFANNSGIGMPVTVVNARRNREFSALDELRRGNVWFTDTGFCDLHFSLNGKEMGRSAILRDINRIEIRSESCYPICRIDLISSGRIIHSGKCNSCRIHRRFSIPAGRIGNYLRASLTDERGNMAFSNAVYIRNTAEK